MAIEQQHPTPEHFLSLIRQQQRGRLKVYLGFAAGWIGLWVVFGHADPATIAAVAAVALGVHLFVVFYEEPTLREKFGADYINYCSNVRRWWPRVRGWDEAR